MMGSDKKLTSTPLDEVSHTFPRFIKDGEQEAVNSSNARMPFKAMFKGSGFEGAPKQPVAPSFAPPSQDDPLEKARQRGFENGYVAGQINACELVQNDLSPVVDAVQESLTQYSTYREKLSQLYSVRCLKLALAVVERISGESTRISVEDLSAAQSIIHEAMVASFGLSLQFNSDDFRCIESVAACKNPLEWKKYLQVGIGSDDALSPGSVGSSTRELEWDAIQDQVANALDKIMAANDELSGE